MSNTDSNEGHSRWFEFSQEVGMHGVRYVCLNKLAPARRIAWLVIILGSLAYFSYATSGFVSDYGKTKLSTKIRVEKASAIPFPTITICNKNLWRASHLWYSSLGLQTMALYEIFKDLYEMGRDIPPPENKYNWTDETYAPIYALTAVDTENFLRDAAHRLQDTFGYCIMYGSYVDCNSVLEVVKTDGGYCFQFNPNGTVNGTSAGVSGGISFMLFAHVDEYSTGPSSYAEGFTLTFHNHYEVPMVTELSVGIAPGTQASVLLHKSEMRRYPPPADDFRSDCLDTQTKTNPLHHFERYSFSACQVECKTEYVIKKCGCRDALQPPVKNSTICVLPDMLYCSNPASKKFPSDPDGLQACDCKDPCLDSEYVAKISLNTFPGTKYAAAMSMDESKIAWMRKNAVILDIFYGKMSYQILEEEPAYNIFDMIANAGGTLGVCIGASILTICEFLEFGLLSLFRWFCYRKHRHGSKGSLIKVAPADTTPYNKY